MEVDHQDVDLGNKTASIVTQTANNSETSHPPSSATVVEASNEIDPIVTNHREMTFGQEIDQFQRELEDDFQAYQTSLHQNPQDNEVGVLDWDDLEKRYDDEMSLKMTAENKVLDEFSALFKQFTLWMQVTNEKEAERALKRLRTRIAFVQISEEQLGEKQEHYNKVLDAFQNAMSLLGNF